MIVRPTALHRSNRLAPLLTVVAAVAGSIMLSYIVIMVLVVNPDDTVALSIPDPVAPYHAGPGERFPLPATPAPPATPAGMVTPAQPAVPAPPVAPVRPDRPLRPER